MTRCPSFPISATPADTAPAAVLGHRDQRAHARDHPPTRPLADVPASSKAWGRATARRSRTRFIVSPARTATTSSSSPEGLTTHEIYPNGISTSLPFDVQLAIVRSIRGMEERHILRPGYAIGIRLLRSARAEILVRDQGHPRPIVLRRPDQRHHRLRGGRRVGCSPAPTPRVYVQKRDAWSPRAATRPTSACWWTT